MADASAPLSTPAVTSRRASRRASRVGKIALSTEGIYGLIIVAGMILVSRNAAASSGEALLSVVVTLLVFYAAHAYASAMSWLASGQGERRTLGEALRRGASDSVGMVVVGAVPIVILALGVIGIVREANAVWLALGTDMLLLGLLGWFVAVTRTGNIWMRLGSALITAAFGGILIALKALVHH